jgi:hypothetical protein
MTRQTSRNGWSTDQITTYLILAARTARRLPPVKVQGYFNVWPAFVRTDYERLVGDDPQPLYIAPSPQDVEKLMEVMRWMQWLELEQRHLVWMRAERYRWEDISKRFGCCPRTAQRRWNCALQVIENNLFAR